MKAYSKYGRYVGGVQLKIIAENGAERFFLKEFDQRGYETSIDEDGDLVLRLYTTEELAQQEVEVMLNGTHTSRDHV